MASKSRKKLKIKVNAPVTIAMTMLCLLFVVITQQVLKHFSINLVEKTFSAVGNAKSAVPFNFKNPVHYLRILLHVFGHSNWIHFSCNFSLILILGPILEERYGSPAIIIMSSVAIIVSGLLNACFFTSAIMGADSIVFMMILLSSYAALTKGEIQIPVVMLFILFICMEFFMEISGGIKDIAKISQLAGGICGSMFGFLVAPKTPKAQKEKTITFEEINTASPRKEKKSLFSKASKMQEEPEVTETEETVIGSIDI